MELQEILYRQGFGTRRVCAGLIQQGWVKVAGEQVLDASSDWQPQGLAYQVQGVDWSYQEPAYLMLYKPAAYECSQKPSAWPSVYTLLPAPLRQRPSKTATQGVQAIGRLDQDTTGLLLFSDDGQFIHKMASPRHHVPKLYQVTVKHELTERQIQQLLEGVVLDDDPKPVRAAACALVHERQLDLTLTEGKYHQVKRMLAAVGNRVEALHRSQIGDVGLGGLAPGQWRWLTPEELGGLRSPRSAH